ncbi:MAG: dCTP deaminase [Candidatus Marsarchaeota archaeon]|jgi:dCTP deaminase|nr:dCTP deaminase [Candidatus Marsarchaeota archaeon]MCL5419026.1 dCTP deaminase [Candidatus Marsarchaeota archaeon]
MILSDFDLLNMIKSGRLKIEPFAEEIVRENGIDFRLADEIAHHKEMGDNFVMDPADESSISNSYSLEKGVKSMIIKPHEQVLLSTHESISMPDDIAGIVELRSTWARHGLSMPPTIIDAGFSGTVTLEVFNNAPYKIELKPMLRFAHVIFLKTTSKVQKLYKGAYSNQNGIKLPKAIKE